MQAALMAQISKNEYKGTQAKNQTCLKHVQNSRPERAEQESDSMLTKIIIDLKAKIGNLHKAMVNHCISVEKPRRRTVIVRQTPLWNPLPNFLIPTMNPKSKHFQ